MKENKKRYNLTMTPSIWKALKIRAIEEGSSVSSIIERLVREYLKKK